MEYLVDEVGDLWKTLLIAFSGLREHRTIVLGAAVFEFLK
jgi:hypothetical protein